jgi:dTDP-4-dehydrorhamnose 3,5-epimerase
LIFNDPTLKIDWKLSPEEMIVSEKDLVLPTFDNIDANF